MLVQMFKWWIIDIPRAKQPSMGTAQQQHALLVKVVLHAVVIISVVLYLNVRISYIICYMAHLYGEPEKLVQTQNSPYSKYLATTGGSFHSHTLSVSSELASSNSSGQRSRSSSDSYL